MHPTAHVGLLFQDPGVLLHLVLQPRPLWRQGFDLCLVDDVLRQALASQWAARFVLLRAAAFPLGRSRLALADNLSIVAGYDVPKVGQWPVADLYRLPVQSFVTRVAGREALVQDLEELPADVGGDRSAERWIEPVDFSFFPPLLLLHLLPRLVLQLLAVACIVELLLVHILGSIEHLLVGGVGRQTLADTLDDALGDGRGVVRLLVHVERHMVDLGEVSVGGVGQVQGDVEKRDDLLVDNDGDAEAVGLEDVRDLLLQSLVLLWFQTAHPQAIVTIEADLDWQVLQL